MSGWSAGVFTRARNWAQDKLNAINPQAALFDQEDDNFATGLNNCVTKDGLNKPSATMDFNSQRLTALGDATGATDAMNRQSADARYGTTAIKTVATSRASTTTLTADPDLLFVAASGTYIVDALLLFNEATTSIGGIQIGFYCTGGAGLAVNPQNLAVGSVFGAVYGSKGAWSISPATAALSITNVAIASTNDGLRIHGVAAGTSLGTIGISWAQNSSNVNATNMLANSWLTVRKIA